MTPIELQSRGMQILIRELGYADAVAFMLQLSPGAGDYTKERQKLLKGFTVEELVAESDRLVKEARGTKPKPRRTLKRKSA